MKTRAIGWCLLGSLLICLAVLWAHRSAGEVNNWMRALILPGGPGVFMLAGIFLCVRGLTLARRIHASADNP